MKCFRLVLAVVLMSFATMAFAQSETHAHNAVATPAPNSGDAQKAGAQKAVALLPSEAEKSFDKLKALAGTWEGHANVIPPVPEVNGKSAQVTFRVASRGHTLMHDLKIEGLPDNPITMLVVDADRLLLTHYCDADNRPRMLGKMSPDGKTAEFDFLDISGHAERGHMHHAVFTLVDANHHTEDWTFMMPGDNAIRVHFDLQRTSGAGAVSGK